MHVRGPARRLEPGRPARRSRRAAAPIDRWILSRLDDTLAVVTERLEDYDATGAGRALEAFVDDLSNWYVRTSRRRFWGGRRGGGGLGRRPTPPSRPCTSAWRRWPCMVAPFCPFVAEEMYGNLVAAHDPDAPESVHLADWPAPGGRHDPDLEAAMAAAREVVTVGRGARSEARLKVRQPLAEAVVACPPALARLVGGPRGPGRRTSSTCGGCGSSPIPASWSR